jgi:hypothetical protein
LLARLGAGMCVRVDEHVGHGRESALRLSTRGRPA